MNDAEASYATVFCFGLWGSTPATKTLPVIYTLLPQWRDEESESPRAMAKARKDLYLDVDPRDSKKGLVGVLIRDS